MKLLLIAICILTVLAQWIVPGSMIWSREKILREGKVFRFRTEPVDPYDPFKGRFIRLDFKEDEFSIIKIDSTWNSYGDVYVLIESGSDGFTKIKDLSMKTPASSADYVKAGINYIDRNSDTAVVHIRYPFTEYYMDEFKAPLAETAYRESNIDSTQRTYAEVSVLKGEAVIKNVMINEKPIKQVILEGKK